MELPPPSQNLNRPSTEPQLQDLLQLLARQIKLTINCVAIGTIGTFDPITQKAAVTINYTKTIFKTDKTTKKQVPQYFAYPVLADCPVIVAQGGSAALTMPIKTGDVCLVLFNDRDMNSYITSGQVGQPCSTTRLHSFSDGIILVGLRPFSNALADYDSSRAVLRNKNAKIAVGEDKLKLENNLTSLKTILDNLMTTLSTLTSSMAGASTVAQIATAAGIANTSLATISTAIGELLE